MPPERMYEVLGQLKTMCVQNRENARELFASHPHLALAVMRMQVALFVREPRTLPANLEKYARTLNQYKNPACLRIDDRILRKPQRHRGLCWGSRKRKKKKPRDATHVTLFCQQRTSRCFAENKYF
jgi:hypothetical protein